MIQPAIQLADYHLGVVLGVGTVGTIYQAIDQRSGVLVAVKLLHESVSREPIIRARFEREMLILERLKHPHIIHYYGGGNDAGRLFYVMEYVDGGSVKDLLENGELSWEEVATCGRQVASALQCAHNHGVIHRDLKPGNLFLTRAGQVKLGDFGIARDLTKADLTGTGLTVGTHGYMAPEQITGDAQISGKADLYSLGCCFYEMLTGEKPFPGENFAQIFHGHLHLPPPHVRERVAEVPEPFDALIVRLLAKKPADRPFNARSVQGELIGICEKFGVHEPVDRFIDPPSAEHPTSLPEKKKTAKAFVGERALVERIERQFHTGPSRDVPWSILGILAMFIVVLSVAAYFLMDS